MRVLPIRYQKQIDVTMQVISKAYKLDCMGYYGEMSCE